MYWYDVNVLRDASLLANADAHGDSLAEAERDASAINEACRAVLEAAGVEHEAVGTAAEDDSPPQPAPSHSGPSRSTSSRSRSPATAAEVERRQHSHKKQRMAETASTAAAGGGGSDAGGDGGSHTPVAAAAAEGATSHARCGHNSSGAGNPGTGVETNEPAPDAAADSSPAGAEKTEGFFGGEVTAASFESGGEVTTAIITIGSGGGGPAPSSAAAAAPAPALLQQQTPSPLSELLASHLPELARGLAPRFAAALEAASVTTTAHLRLMAGIICMNKEIDKQVRAQNSRAGHDRFRQCRVDSALQQTIVYSSCSFIPRSSAAIVSG